MAKVIVTGASSGLGLEIARQLAARGDEVVAVARSAAALEELAASSGVTAVVLDVGTSEGRDELFAQVPTCDILVNNAGFGMVGEFAATDRAVLDNMVDVNVLALTDLSARYLPQMVARGSGRLLNVASTAAFQPGPRMAVYYATKAYVLSLTEAIAEELSSSPVTATAFCPGAFASGFQQTAKADTLRLIKGRKLPTSKDMAVAAIAAMDAGRVITVPGLMNKIGASSVRFAPRSVVRKLSKWVASEA